MNYYFVVLLTLFRMGLFGAAHGLRREGGKGPYFSKTCHTYSTMMKLGTVIPYLRKIQKYINQVTQLSSSAKISNFSLEIGSF